MATATEKTERIGSWEQHKRRPSFISSCNRQYLVIGRRKAKKTTSNEPTRERHVIEPVVQDHTIGVVEGPEPAESVDTMETVEDTTGSAIEESTTEPLQVRAKKWVTWLTS